MSETKQQVPIVDAIWSDGAHLMLRKTTSDEYYCLDVSVHAAEALRPFVELGETGAIRSLMRDSVSSEGWLLPVNVFLKLKLFLTHFHDVLPPTPSVSPVEEKQKRDQYSAGLEYPVAVIRENRATVFQLSFQEARLLAMIYLSTHELEGIYQHSDEYSSRVLKGLETLDAFWPYRTDETPGEDTSDSLVILSCEESGFRRMCGRYMVSRLRDAAPLREGIMTPLRKRDTIPSLKRGDLLQLAYNPCDDTTNIYDGDKFIRLEHYEECAWFIPSQFQVPTPFPVSWWAGLLEDREFQGYFVRPNFGEIIHEMEYVNKPELPANVKQWIEEQGIEVQDWSELRFEWHNRTSPDSKQKSELASHTRVYHIYFTTIYIDARLTYEAITERIQHPTNEMYQALDETTIVTSI